MTESSSSSLSSRVCKHAMDAQHRKCNREHQGIPEAPQARCSAAGPLPAQPGGKLSTDRTFCRRGMRLVRLGNCATLHPSVLGAHAVRAVLQFDFVFFHSFFIGFPTASQRSKFIWNDYTVCEVVGRGFCSFFKNENLQDFYYTHRQSRTPE